MSEQEEETQTTTEEQKTETETETETETVDYEKRYRDLESDYTKKSQRLKSFETQLNRGGYTVDDENQIYAPAPPEPPKTPQEPPEDEEIADPVAARLFKRMSAERAEDRETIDLLSMGATQAGKREFLDMLGKDAQKAAGESYDAKMKGIPARVRANPATEKAVRGMVLAEMLEDMGVGALSQGGGQTRTSLGTLGAGASDPPGGGGGTVKAAATITADHRKIYAGLGGKEALGKTLEEFAGETAEQDAIDQEAREA